MNSLTRRVDKLEVGHTPSPEEQYRFEKLRAAIESARDRIRRFHPEHQFSEPLPSGGKFDLVAALDRGRQLAMARFQNI